MNLQLNRIWKSGAMIAAVLIGAIAAQPSPARAQKQNGITLTPAQRQKQIQAKVKAQQTALYKELGLSQPQIVKVEAINDKYNKKMQQMMMGMRKKYGPNPPLQKRQALMAELQPMAFRLLKGQQEEVRTVLTPAQRKKLDALLEKQRAIALENTKRLQQAQKKKP